MTWECDKPDGRPCRVMETRACPSGRAAGCPGEPCARFEITEAEAPAVWASELLLAQLQRDRRGA